MRWLLALLLLLVGCDRFDGEGVLVAPPCAEQSVEKLVPAKESSDAWIGGLVWVDLACPAPGATMSLSGPAGAVAGSTFIAHGGRQIRFEPATWLDPGANYLARLDTTDGYREWDFRTSALGAPVSADLAERALALHPAQGSVLDPPGFLEDLQPALQAGLHPVIQFLDVPIEGAVNVRLGGRLDARTTAEQDLADRTWDLQAAWTNPVWAVGPIDVSWELFDFTLVLEDAVFEGAVAADVGSGGGGKLEGHWDTRPADDSLGTGPGTLCERALTTSGTGCTPCRDGVEACLPFSLRNVPADAWGGLLQVVDP